jgi:uncharacterized protein (DUF2164 family)
MSYSIKELSRAVYAMTHPPAEPSEAERIRDVLMPEVDLDESQLELFAEYLAELKSIGVLLHNQQLHDALNAYPENMETAIQAVLEYAERLKEKHETFKDRYHVTNCLTKALREGWQADFNDPVNDPEE